LSDQVKFDFLLGGSIGWARGRIAFGDREVEVTASYLGDALGDLLAAMLKLTQGAAEARASWWEEPGEYRWVFSVAPLDVSLRLQDTRLRLLEFPHMPGAVEAPDEKGHPLIEGDCSLVELVGAVAACARRTLEEHGVNGYEAKWHMHPFPGEDLALLEEWLGKQA
jgi:hypothetical protein